MWKTFFLLLIMLVLTCGDGFDTARGGLAAPQHGDELTVPLEGLDPVLLTRGEEAQGDEQFSVTRGRFRYLFARAETKAAFEQEPARYEIQLGGSCARMGPTVQGNPDLYAVVDGRIYLFGSPACRTAFKAKPASFLETEAAPAPASEEARSRGRALVEKAVEAAGGAARIDGLVSYQERGTVGADAAHGGQIKTALVVLYPDRVRQERTLSFGTIATVLTPGGGFFVLPRGGAELTDAQRAEYEKLFSLTPLAILRARRAADFTAAAAGPGKAGDAAVELVDVAFGGVRARLGIDPATGRVLSLAFRGRGNQGAFGQVVRNYSDFRNAGGLTLPFKTAGTFDGEPDPAQSATVEAVVVNGEVAPALFERPKSAAMQ